MKPLRALFFFFLVVALALVLLSWYVSRPLFEGLPGAPPSGAFEILPINEALTFARTTDGKLLLVVAADEREVSAVNLDAALGGSASSPLEALQLHGFEALAAVAAAERIRVPMSSLGLPFEASYPHIAAGTNFTEHADEVGLDGAPFLFPKLSAATAWNATVPGATRLDYEVELCAVTLEPVRPRTSARLGYVICNDFTDRWTLLKEIDTAQPMGRTGFADAKGGVGRLPIGPFLVVPSEASSFYQRIGLGLSVNGMLRQRAAAGLMIWTPQQIAEHALSACREDFASVAGLHRLTPCEAIPAGSLLLTGTPAGVMFHYLNIWRGGAYLQSGDEVVAWGDHLGSLRNTVR